MNEELFNLLLNSLTPETLAYLIRDLAESQTNWQLYPEEAPSPASQQMLRQLQATFSQVGAERASAAGLDFAQLLQQAAASQEQDDWTAPYDHQVRQNWLSDLE